MAFFSSLTNAPSNQSSPTRFSGRLDTPVKAGQEKRMQESYRQDPASQPGPESCGDGREVVGEAWTGETADPVLSCEREWSRVPTSLSEAEGHTDGGVSRAGQVAECRIAWLLPVPRHLRQPSLDVVVPSPVRPNLAARPAAPQPASPAHLETLWSARGKLAPPAPGPAPAPQPPPNERFYAKNPK